MSGIIQAADDVVSYFFPKGRFAGGSAYGNWYHWEIACPAALGNIAMVLYDELGADRVRLYGGAIQILRPFCTRGGPNSNGPVMTSGHGGRPGRRPQRPERPEAHGGHLLRPAVYARDLSHRGAGPEVRRDDEVLPQPG